MQEFSEAEKILKKLGIGLGVFLVLLVGVVLIVPSFLDWNKYKEEIETTASDLSGRTVKINGDISFSLLPVSALSAKEVIVANMEGGKAENFLTLNSLDVKVSLPSVLSSLFGGRMKVEKLILVDPVISLEMKADGQGNWQMEKTPQPSIQSEDAAGGSFSDLSLEKFQIKNGQISFEDLSTGQINRLTKINSTLSLKTLQGPFAIEGDAQYRGVGASLNLKLGKIRKGRKLPVNFSLSFMDSGVTAGFMGGALVDGTASELDGKLSLNAGDLGELLSVMQRLSGKSKTEITRFEQGVSITTGLTLGMDHGRLSDLDLRYGESRAQGAIRLSLGEKIDLNGALSVNKINIDPLLDILRKINPQTRNADIPDKEAFLRAELIDRLKGKFDLKIGAMQYNKKIASQIALHFTADKGALKLERLRAKMPGGSVASLSGMLKNNNAKADFTGLFKLNSGNLRGLLTWLKLDLSQVPQGRLTQFSIESHLKAGPELVQFYGMKGVVDTARFKGGISVALQARSSYGIDLTLENANLDSYYLAQPDQKTDLKALFERLNHFDVKAKLAVNNLTLSGLKIKQGRVELLLLGGKLQADVIELKDVAGVNIKAHGMVKNLSDKPFMSLDMVADATSLNRLQRGLKLDNGVSLAKLGKVKLSAKFGASLEKMDMVVTSDIGGSKLSLKGLIRSATLKQFPDVGSMEVDVDLSNSSFVRIIDQLDLGLTKPRPADDRPFALKGRLKGNRTLFDVDGVMDIAGGKIALKGRSSEKGPIRNIDMALDIQGAQVREFVRGLGMDFKPSRKNLGPLQLKGTLSGSTDHYSLNNIVGKIGPVKLSGTATANFTASKPVFYLSLTAGEIPLHDFMSSSVKSNSKDKKHWGNWSREPLQMSLLRSYDGTLELTAASLKYNDYSFDRPTFKASLSDGILHVENFRGYIFAGELALKGSFGGMKKTALKVDFDLKKASLEQATQAAAGIKPLSSQFALKGIFDAQGASQHALVSSLQGTSQLVISPGMINGVDFPRLSKFLSESKSPQAFLELLDMSLTGGQTAFKGGQTIITAHKGNFQMAPFDVEMEGATSRVQMAVDPGRWTMNLKSDLSLTDHAEAPPVALKVTGRLDDPVVDFQTARLQKYVGARIAAQVLQKMVAGEGGLEGLFGVDKAETPLRAIIEEGIQQPEEKKDLPPEIPPLQTPQEAQTQNDPVEDFGKRLLQKLFQDKSKKSNEEKPENSPE